MESTKDITSISGRKTTSLTTEAALETPKDAYSPAASPKVAPTSVAAAIRASIENDNRPTCYICLDTTQGEAYSDMELIAPCYCSYVHRKCLDHWRATSFTHKAMTHCPNCRDEYEIETRVQSEKETNDLKSKIHVAKWLRALFVVGIIVFGSLVLYLIDAGTPKFMNLNWNALDGQIYRGIGLTSVPRYVVYLVLSLLMTLVISAIVGIISICCSRTHRQTTIDSVQQDWSCDLHNCCNYGGCCDGVYNSSCSDLGCGDCCDCGGSGDGGDCDCCSVVYLVVFLVGLACFLFVGVFMLLSAIVGGIGSAVDRRSEKKIRKLQTKLEWVRNKRPIVPVNAV